MKKYFLYFVVFNLFVPYIYSQELPSWVRYGLNINEIKSILGVNSDGVSVSTNNEIGRGIWASQRRSDRPNQYHYIAHNNFTYQFEIDPQVGLTNVLIAGRHNVMTLVNNLNNKYGSSYFNDGTFYWGREISSESPRYIENIMIFIYEENFVNVLYVLRK